MSLVKNRKNERWNYLKWSYTVADIQIVSNFWFPQKKKEIKAIKQYFPTHHKTKTLKTLEN